MKFIALDVGTRRIGVASCDSLEIAASPHSTVPMNKAAAEAIVKLAATEEAKGIVIGLPLSLDGNEGENCIQVRRFSEEIRKRTDLPIEFVDERMTSKIAETHLLDAGMRREKRRTCRDEVAAALILQSFLDRRRR